MHSIKFSPITETEFLKSYPIYKTLLSSAQGKVYFKALNTFDFFLAASVITEHLGLPAVTAANYFIKKDMTGKNFEKQFLGALTCCIMEKNAYEKTDIKKSVPHKGYTKGEVYRKK
jgi:hypothetical protein